MFFFHTPKPRRFHHEYMFVDERKEMLQALKERYSKVEGEESSYHEKMVARVKEGMNRHRNARPRFQPLRLLPIGLMFLLLLFVFMVMWFCLR